MRPSRLRVIQLRDLARWSHCPAAFSDADQTRDARPNRFGVPHAHPVVAWMQRYAACRRCCGGSTLAAVLEATEPGCASADKLGGNWLKPAKVPPLPSIGSTQAEGS